MAKSGADSFRVHDAQRCNARHVRATIAMIYVIGVVLILAGIILYFRNYRQGTMTSDELQQDKYSPHQLDRRMV